MTCVDIAHNMSLHCTVCRLKRIRQSKIFQWCSSRSRSPHPSQPDTNRSDRSVGDREGEQGREQGTEERRGNKGGQEGQGRGDGTRERRGEGKRGEERVT
jgi:hypothetical protein